MIEHSVLIAGSGGQGILFLGKLLAYAAMIQGREVTWFPSYGAEMRGGTANCTVVIADEPIGSPIVRNPQIGVILNAASYAKFLGRIHSGGTIIYNSSLVQADSMRQDLRILGIPATDIASSFDNTRLSNMAMLGGLIAATGIVSAETVFGALDETTPDHRISLLPLNKAVLLKGIEFLGNQESPHR